MLPPLPSSENSAPALNADVMPRYGTTVLSLNEYAIRVVPPPATPPAI